MIRHEFAALPKSRNMNGTAPSVEVIVLLPGRIAATEDEGFGFSIRPEHLTCVVSFGDIRAYLQGKGW